MLLAQRHSSHFSLDVQVNRLEHVCPDYFTPLQDGEGVFSHELLVEEVEAAVKFTLVFFHLEEVEVGGLVLELVKRDAVDLRVELLDEDHLLPLTYPLHLVSLFAQEVNHGLFLGTLAQLLHSVSLSL